ncbi:MAG: hypothetical protein WC942_11790 [Clostridia bacterium]
MPSAHAASGIVNDSINFYLHSFYQADDTLDIYTHGFGVVNEDLFFNLTGHQSQSDDISFYIGVNAPDLASGTIDVLMRGISSGTQHEFGSIPWTMVVEDLLFHDSIAVYIEGEAVPVSPTSVSDDIATYLQGPSVTEFSDDINYYLTGSSQSGVIYYGQSIDYRMTGLGTTAGAIPIDDTIDLHMQTYSGVNNTMDLYMFGTGFDSDSVELCMIGVSGFIYDDVNFYLKCNDIDSTIPLFIRGYRS